jgi:hypothetical protein
MLRRDAASVFLIFAFLTALAATAATTTTNTTTTNTTNTTKTSKTANPLLNYRLGLCEQCHCSALQWTCVELLSKHYKCTDRTHATFYNVSRHLGTHSIGNHFSWSVPSNLPTRHWLRNCVSHATLHNTGLTFRDDGILEGVISPLSEKEIWLTAFHTAISTSNGETITTVTRLNLHLYINTHVPTTVHSFETVHPNVSRAADRAVAYYNSWESGQQNHADAIKGMNQEFARMKSTLDVAPHDAFGWAILGALHMNTHKLLENVLLEAEHYLGHALTFGGAAADFAEKNLEGCYAKRQLEAAKFIWMEGMEALVKGIAVLAVEMKAETEVGSDGTMLVEMDNEKLARSELLFVRAEHLFERASKKKSGWGWGVNNGEIYLGLASSILLQSRIERRSSACKLVEMAADRNARLPWTLYLQTFCRSKMDHDEAEMEKLREFVTSTMQRTLVMVQPKPREDQLPLLPHQR